MQTIEFGIFQKECKNVLEKVVSNTESIIVAQDNGKDVVLMSLQEYNSWAETLHLMRSRNNYNRLMTSIEQTELGNYTQHDLIED